MQGFSQGTAQQQLDMLRQQIAAFDATLGLLQTLLVMAFLQSYQCIPKIR